MECLVFWNQTRKYENKLGSLEKYENKLGKLRDAVRYQISCFFIKFINSLWPPPPSFYKTRCEFFLTFFRFFFIEYDSLIFKTDFTSFWKMLKKSFLICLRRPPGSPPEYTKNRIIFFINGNDPPRPFVNFIKKQEIWYWMASLKIACAKRQLVPLWPQALNMSNVKQKNGHWPP